MATEWELSNVSVEVADAFESIFSESYNVCETIILLVVFLNYLILIQVLLLDNLGLEYLLLEVVFKFSLASPFFLVL
jgi:hypothetical protein